MLELTDRDYAVLLLDEVDLEAQLLAVKPLLQRIRMADQQLAADIATLGERAAAASGEYGRFLEDTWVDHLHDSVFQDAAHSMGAIGVLAPTIESLFVAVYRGIADFRPPVMPVTPSGVRAAFSDDPRFWDPRFVYSRQGRSKNLVRGLVQLADATGLGPYLPSNLPMMLDALFRYRNKMFHHGLEWPPLERDRFERTIAGERWPADWFTRSTSGRRTWIIYMSNVLIEHAIDRIDQVLEGIGRFVRSRYPSAPNT